MKFLFFLMVVMLCCFSLANLSTEVMRDKNKPLPLTVQTQPDKNSAYWK